MRGGESITRRFPERYSSPSYPADSSYKLRTDGLVANPKGFSFDELKGCRSRNRLRPTSAFQGLSGVAQWGGVPMKHSIWWGFKQVKWIEAI